MRISVPLADAGGLSRTHHSCVLTRKVSDMQDVKATLAQRAETYGEYSDNAATSEDLIERMMREPGWNRLSPDKKKSLRTIQDKISRILSGDPEYKDNWHDIAGYAKLSEDRCKLI